CHRVQFVEDVGVAPLRLGDDCAVVGAVGDDGTKLVSTREVAGEPRYEPGPLIGIVQQHLGDVAHLNGVVVRVPAVEVGHHGDGRVANLRLAGELGFGQVGHADHRIT